jgi:hypothetical protein
MPITHEALGPQTMPQKPQLFGSLSGSEQPVAQHSCSVEHAGPPLQVPEHMLLMHFDPVAQTLPQKPQLFGSLVVSMQVVPQHIPPFGQPLVWQVLAWHMPPTHAEPVGQALPQKPQFFGSVLVLTSQPSL